MPRTGNHKGCPYNRFAGAYFQRDDGGRLLLWVLHSRDYGTVTTSEYKLYIVGISNALLFQGGTLRRDAIVPVDAKQ